MTSYTSHIILYLVRMSPLLSEMPALTPAALKSETVHLYQNERLSY